MSSLVFNTHKRNEAWQTVRAPGSFLSPWHGKRTLHNLISASSPISHQYPPWTIITINKQKNQLTPALQPYRIQPWWTLVPLNPLFPLPGLFPHIHPLPSSSSNFSFKIRLKWHLLSRAFLIPLGALPLNSPCSGHTSQNCTDLSISCMFLFWPPQG